MAPSRVRLRAGCAKLWTRAPETPHQLSSAAAQRGKVAHEAPSQLALARCSGAKRSYLVKGVADACCGTSGPKRVRSCELTPIDARRSKFAAANSDAKWRPERLCPRLSNYSSSQNLKSVNTITLDRITNGLQPTLKLVNTSKERNLC
jgi:hypothetical protein